MSGVKETTVYDMKTNFSKYAAELLDGTYDEIIVKNRNTPTLRILPYTESNRPGLRYGLSEKLGHATVSDDWGINDGDDEIAEMFSEELQ